MSYVKSVMEEEWHRVTAEGTRKGWFAELISLFVLFYEKSWTKLRKIR